MKYFAIAILTLFTSISFAQKPSFKDLQQMDSTSRAEYFRLKEAKVDSLIQIDYLDYNYKYLDKNFAIDMSSQTFDSIAVKNNYIAERIRSYKDSLIIALMAEFIDQDQERIARLSILYSWKRLGYHTWQKEDEAQAFAVKFGINHPWRMKEFLIDEDNQNRKIKKFFNQLITKVEKETGRDDLTSLSKNDLLDVAMRSNPERIDAFQKRRQELMQKREAN